MTDLEVKCAFNHKSFTVQACEPSPYDVSDIHGSYATPSIIIAPALPTQIITKEEKEYEQ